MIVRVDDSEVQAAKAEARRVIRTLPAAFRDAGRRAAQASRRGHGYQNQTGKTQGATRSITEAAKDAIFTVVEINVPHASYLMAGGKRGRFSSLTALEDAIQEMTRELDFAVDGIEHALAK